MTILGKKQMSEEDIKCQKYIAITIIIKPLNL